MNPPIGHTIPLPNTAGANRNIAGTAYEFDVLPPSKAGRSGPFELPTGSYPPKKAFDVWVEYYVNGVGAYIELLNALQFKLHENPAANVQDFANRFAELAALLNIGSGKSIPAKLIWPLKQKWSCAPDEPLTKGEFVAFTVTLDCADPANQYAVVNCEIKIHATWNIAPESNSSSYLATGSSSG